MHVAIPMGTQTIHIIVVYGFTKSALLAEQRQRNEPLLESALQLLAELGKAPAFLVGDLNTTIEASGQLNSALRMGHLFDLARLQPGGVSPTCFPKRSSKGTRIDHLLANSTGSALARSVRKVEDCGIPTHVPLLCDLDIALACQKGKRFRLPKELPLGWGLKDETQEAEEAAKTLAPIFQRSADMWGLCIRHGDVDGAYEILSADAESYCMARAGLTTFVPSGIRGRGTTHLQEYNTAPVCSDDSGAATCRLVRLQKLQRRLEEVARKRFLRGDSAMDLPDTRNLWSQVQIDAPKLLKQPVEENPPNSCRLGELIRTCRMKVTAEQCRAQQHRREEMQRWTRQQWVAERGRVYALCKDEESKPLTMLQRQDGTFTSEVSEVDALLRGFWLQTFQLYTHIPAPTWEAFAAKYSAYFPKGERMRHRKLTPQDLREVLRRMNSGTSIGPDGWRAAELKQMPDLWLQRLCDLFDVVEQLGRWPQSLAQGLIAPIPKADGFSPKDTRPITVMSTVYRLWAGARSRQLLEWQETWATENLHSYRPERGCDGAWWTQALRIEEAVLTGESLAGICLDFVKAFDRLPFHMLLELARNARADPSILHALNGMHGQLQRRFKLQCGLVGEAFSSTNGILQGCPLSVIMLNLYIQCWLNLVTHKAPEALPQSYADDLLLNGWSLPALKHALQITEEFASDTGMQICPKKSCCWATTLAFRAQLHELKVGGASLPAVSEARYLGAFLSFDGRRHKTRVEHHIEAASRVCQRISMTRLPLEVRAILASALVIPRALYACCATASPKRTMQKLRAAVGKAVWGQANRWRANEVLFTLICKGTFTRAFPS